MNANSQLTRPFFIVNNTRKEVRAVPFTYTPKGNDDNVGFVDGMVAVLNAVKVGCRHLIYDEWSVFDDIKILNDQKVNVEEYQRKGYSINPPTSS